MKIINSYNHYIVMGSSNSLNKGCLCDVVADDFPIYSNTQDDFTAAAKLFEMLTMFLKLLWLQRAV